MMLSVRRCLKRSPTYDYYLSRNLENCLGLFLLKGGSSVVLHIQKKYFNSQRDYLPLGLRFSYLRTPRFSAILSIPSVPDRQKSLWHHKVTKTISVSSRKITCRPKNVSHEECYSQQKCPITP